MTIFNYTALKDGTSEIVKGKVEADDMREARAAVRALGFTPTNIVEEQAVKKEEKKKPTGRMPKLGLHDQIDFTSTLQILSAAGIPIIESLLFIENDAAKLKIRQVATELRRQIMNGGTFSGTVAKYPEQFGQVYIGLVRAGEDSGELEKTLDRLLELLNKQAAIRSKVIGTLMYPVFVILLAVFIVIVMLVFVFPVFKEMFDSMGMQLPWITRVLMEMGIFLKKNWYGIPIGFFAISAFISFLFRWKPSKWKIDDIVLKIPVLTDLIQYSNFANFIAVMQVAYDAGVPILECLYLSNMTLTKEEIHSAEDTIKECFDEFIKLYRNEFLKSLYKGMYEAVAEHRLWSDEFTVGLEKKWFRAFVACDAMSIIADEILGDYIKKYESTATAKKKTFRQKKIDTFPLRCYDT